MKVVELPREPESFDFEDLVAAVLQASGQYVETNLRPKVSEESDLNSAEIDVAAWDYTSIPVAISVAEVKSGKDWGMRDIWALRGQMAHYQLQHGYFVVSKPKGKHDPTSINQLFWADSITFVQLDDFALAGSKLVSVGIKMPEDDWSICLWRYAHWIERTLHRVITQHKKDHHDQVIVCPSSQTTAQYYGLLQQPIFDFRDVASRASSLYEAYRSHEQLSMSCARDVQSLTGKTSMMAANQSYREAIYDGAHPLIQSALWLEHLARLEIMRCGVDYAICEAHRMSVPPLDNLPPNFTLGVEYVRNHPNLNGLPLLWQAFMWGLGGFIILDHRDADYNWLEQHSGIPAAHIESGLKAYDVFFPRQHGGSWFHDIGGIQLLTLFPSPFRGLGASERRWSLGCDAFEDLPFTHTVRIQLRSWAQCAVDLLSP